MRGKGWRDISLFLTRSCLSSPFLPSLPMDVWEGHPLFSSPLEGGGLPSLLPHTPLKPQRRQAEEEGRRRGGGGQERGQHRRGMLHSMPTPLSPSLRKGEVSPHVPGRGLPRKHFLPGTVPSPCTHTLPPSLLFSFKEKAPPVLLPCQGRGTWHGAVLSTTT